MKKYELMYILLPNLEEGVLKAEKEKIAKVLTSNKATLGKIEEWGLRDLAYEINKVKKGYYVVLEFQPENSNSLKDINSTLSLNSNILRFLIVRKED